MITTKKDSFFQSLIWHAGPLRILFEAIICFAIFNASFYLIFNNDSRQILVLQVTVLSLIVAIMMFIDRSILCASLSKWEKSFFSAISGELSLAKQQLDGILHSKFQPPARVFHLRYAELLYMEGNNNHAGATLSKAQIDGAQGDECQLIKLRGMLFSKDNFELAEIENKVTLAEQFVFQGESALVYLENAMINLFRKNDYRAANEQLSLAMFMPPEMHPSYASTYDLSHLLKLCLGLHTGKADAVLQQLSGLLEFLKLQIGSSPGLRPYLSFAYLERAKYYARRKKTKDKSQADVDLALAICRYPAHLEIARGL